MYNSTNTNGGLAGNIIWSIAVDADGNKWFGTNNGVSKFDGTNWTVYNNSNTDGGLAYNNVLSIAIDAQGNKWFGTNNGVSKFNGDDWTVYNNSNTDGGLAYNNVYSIAIDTQGNKWFGTYGGGISVLSSGTLPLNLFSFTGKNTGTGNQLNWQTANENNHKGFAIERSSNGKDFQEIGFIAGKNTSEKQSYTFTDTQAPAGKSYYRLKLEDVNGSVEYSNIVVLENKLQTASFTVYPNPVKNQLFFTAQQTGAVLNIYNSFGKQVFQQQITEQENVIDVSSFVKGIYVFGYGEEKGKFVKE